MNQNFVMIFIILISFNSYFTRNKKKYNFNGSKVWEEKKKKWKNEKRSKGNNKGTKFIVCVCV